MLISRVLEGEERDESTKNKLEADDHSYEYRTASELFEIMSRDQSFPLANADDDSLTPGDLVVLYKNIDKGAKPMPNTDKFMRQKPNQYVETIVYNEDQESDGSEVSDVYSSEELQRIDFLNSHLSLENKLCKKFGGVDIQSSNLTTEYNKHFIFQDPYIKDQLNSLNVGFNQFESSFLPASLLDYICCKRLEDNYNFYMDNIITYVKHTIEQLKRISNGEYLTDRTKEKWKEVDNTEINKSAKILATSTSIPLHVESKSNGQASTWNDLVHSEVDIRYLSKILEKQIIIEVPKLICDSYKLFSKRCADNLIISCKKGNENATEDSKEENASRVDLVFRLQKSQSGHMMGNINSIMIVQTTPNIIDNYSKAIMPDNYTENRNGTDKTIKIIEICKDEEDNPNTVDSTIGDAAESKDTYFGDYETQYDSVVGTNDYPCSDIDYNISKNESCNETTESTEIFKNSLNSEPFLQSESSYNVASSDKLTSTMKKLNQKMCLPEESGDDVSFWTNTISKKKSPTRVRIKSPYENRSFILEEKKRKRLLEIRERREKKKLALGESCKINKHKYPKGVVIPQPSSSVTKLSITNKSFYNSIYGQAIAIENKQIKGKNHGGIKQDSIPEVPLDEISAEGESPSLTCERNSEKYINRSYYLDNAITEVMYMEMKNKGNYEENGCSASTSVVSSDFRDNMKLLSQIIGPPATDLHKEDVSPDNTFTLNETHLIDEKDDLQTIENVQTSPSVENIVPANSPTNVPSHNKSDHKKATSSLECRKSIDKIYNLLKKLSKNSNEEKLPPKNKSLLPLDVIEDRESSTIQGSDSGTSVKHHLTSSNPSYFSFGKTNEVKSKMSTIKKLQTPVVPKVIISTKPQPLKSDIDKSKKNKKVILNTPKPEEDPIKAISQLLHNIDNVQKTRHRATETKDITDEAKEARGEAVRGPPKFYSRLNSLAQPKKSYVQAHSEEYHTKYGKNLMADRLQKLATTSPNVLERKVGFANSRTKPRKTGTEAISLVSAKPAPVPTIASAWRSASSSPKSLSPMPPFKYNKIPQTPETLKKVVHVETCVKSHCERATVSSKPSGVLPLENFSRVPLLPNDIDLISITSTNTAEESNELGNKLHDIIDTMLNTNTSNLDVLSERVEIDSKSKNTTEFSFVDSLCRREEPVSEELDFPVDVFEDKNIITAVAEDNKKVKENVKDSINFNQPELRNLTTEFAKSENALCRQIPVGTFQKRLRIKNLTLTPKQSIKSPFLLQSGDTAGSVLLKNSLSQNFTICGHDKLSDIKTFPMLSKSELDWSFVKFPMQITTVGYAFPKYPIIKLDPDSNLKSLREETKEISKSADVKIVKNSIQCSETTKCPDTEQFKVNNKYAVQVDVRKNSAIVNHSPRYNITKENKVVNAEDVTKTVIETKAEAVQLVSDGEQKPLKKMNDIPSIDYTASLDMLVGLLNEIQKITTCHTHITNADRNEQQCKEFEIIIDDRTTFEKYSTDKPREIVSTTSLDKLRKLESSPSVYTFYLPSDEEHDSCANRPKDKNICRPIYEDKEVYVDFHERETVNRFTEVPSIFPITISHGTNVTNSLIGVLSEPSSQSLFSSYVDYKSINSNNSFNTRNMIIELPKPMAHDKSSRHSLVPYEKKLKLKKTVELINVLSASDAKKENYAQANIENRYKNMCCINDHNPDFNQSIKMKRDILVTVYSILVFTVFAALSFPEMMYRI